jgi:hypothetical protein
MHRHRPWYQNKLPRQVVFYLFFLPGPIFWKHRDPESPLSHERRSSANSRIWLRRARDFRIDRKQKYALIVLVRSASLNVENRDDRLSLIWRCASKGGTCFGASNRSANS